MKKLFVLNCGSSSIKYRLFDTDAGFRPLAEGIVERIGEAVADYDAGFAMIADRLREAGVLEDFSELAAAGHRVVHGGEHLVAATRIDAAVEAEIERLIPLAPLHNPANLEGIRALRRAAPRLPQVAVFDTAFHRSMPPEAYRYAVPGRWYREYGIRRFGFHGISHHYMLEESAHILGRAPDACNLITLHLGNGASVTAIESGESIETSMGYTPMEGLVMGTRCGDIDAGILLSMAREQGMDAARIDEILNRESGLKGLCGSNDMREILQMRERGDRDAALAVSLFCRRARKYIGAYAMLLGRVDAIVFAGGIGTHAAPIRQEICEGLAPLGIRIDSAENGKPVEAARIVSDPASRSAVIAMQTDEELQIARQTQQLLWGETQ